MKYKLYQIHLTDAEVDKVNAEGHNSVPKHLTKIDMSFAKNDTGSLAKEWIIIGTLTYQTSLPIVWKKYLKSVTLVQKKTLSDWLLCILLVLVTLLKTKMVNNLFVHQLMAGGSIMAVREKSVEELVIDLDGPKGNAFYLLGTAQQFSRDLGLDGNKIINEMKSGDYINLLKTFDSYFGSYVTLETNNKQYLEAL